MCRNENGVAQIRTTCAGREQILEIRIAERTREEVYT